MIRLPIFFALFYYVHGDCKSSVTTASGSNAPKNICSGALIFEDNFDTLDKNKWHHEQTLSGGGNWEFQWYSDDEKNSYVKNGVLHIKPTFVADEFGEDFLYHGTLEIPADKCTNSDHWGCKRTGTERNVINPIKSARLRTMSSFAFKYGKLEIRAKLPTGDWLWPAMWLLPETWRYGNWPRSGEIDLMESRGNKELYSGKTNIGVQQVSSTLHWGPNSGLNRYYKTHYEKNLKQGFNKDFHLYQLEWTPNYLKFSVDNQQIGIVKPPAGGFWELGELQSSGESNPWTSSKMAPFNEEFHILLNLAVGGTNGFFPDNADNKLGPKPWKDNADNAPTTFWQAKSTWSPTWNMGSEDSHLQVDYVRVWAL